MKLSHSVYISIYYLNLCDCVPPIWDIICEIHRLDSGHFAIEDCHDEIADSIQCSILRKWPMPFEFRSNRKYLT
jgi:hypothetical protein